MAAEPGFDVAGEPARGGHYVADVLGWAGRDQLAGAISGALVAPPLHHLTGMRPTAAGPGSATFTMPASGWLASHAGPIPGGMLAVLADGALAGALQSTLPPWVHFTTAELSMSYLRPALPDGRALTARGRLIHAGRSLALTDAVVLDADGRELAHATSRCFVFPPATQGSGPARAVAGAAGRGDRPAYDGPDPWQRQPGGAVADPTVLAGMTGLDQWRAWVSGALPAPPVAGLTGLRPTYAEAGRVDVAMPATGWLGSPTGFVEGGFLVLLADTAIAAAAGTLAGAGTAYVSVDVTVKFLRPVRPDGRDLVAQGRVRHAGRTLAVAGADVADADRRLVVTALGSVMLLPGRMGAPPAVEDEPAPAPS